MRGFGNVELAVMNKGIIDKERGLHVARYVVLLTFNFSSL
jgi:hypothetical protein